MDVVIAWDYIYLGTHLIYIFNLSPPTKQNKAMHVVIKSPSQINVWLNELNVEYLRLRHPEG